MFKQKIVVGGAVLAVLSMAMLSIPSLASSSTKLPGTTSNSKTLNMTVVDGLVGIPFFDTINCGAKAAGKAFNVDVNTVGPPEFDVPVQVSMINAAAETHPAGMVIAPDDPTALIATVKSLRSRGILVATVDLSLSKPAEIANFRPNSLVLGAEAALEMGRALGGSGVVFPMGVDPSVVANQERADGFIKELKAKYPKIKILPEVYPGTDQATAARDAAATLEANPDITGIFTTDGIDATAASSALRAAHDTKVKVVAWDADPDEVQAVKSGAYYAIVAQPPYMEGYQAVKLLAQIARGQVKLSSVKYENYLPGVVVTKANVNSASVRPFLYVASC